MYKQQRVLEESRLSGGYYTVEEKNNHYNITVYFNKQEEKNIFEISYDVDNAAIFDKDVVRFNFTPIGQNWEVPIDSFCTVVSVPVASNLGVCK